MRAFSANSVYGRTLALLERDGPQARADYVCHEMAGVLQCDWVAFVGEDHVIAGSSSKEPRVRFKLGANTFLIIKHEAAPRDLPIDVVYCNRFDEDMKSYARERLREAFMNSIRAKVPAHLENWFEEKYGGKWECFITPPGRNPSSSYKTEKIIIRLLRGEDQFVLIRKEARYG